MWRAYLFLFVIAALIFPLLGCGRGIEDWWKVAGEYQRGKLCIYSAHSEVQLAYEIDAFYNAYPEIALACDKGPPDEVLCQKHAHAKRDDIDVKDVDCEGSKWEVVRMSTGRLLEQIEYERDNGGIKADVIGGLAISHLIGLLDRMQAYAPRGLTEIVEESASSMRPDVWEWFVDSERLDEGERPRWFGVNLFTLGLCVNTTKRDELEAEWKEQEKMESSHTDAEVDAMWLAELPWKVERGITQLKSWDKVFDPEGPFKGHVAIPRPDASGTGFNFLMGVLSTRGDGNENTAAWEWMDDVDKVVTEYTVTGSKSCEIAEDPKSDVIVGLTFDGTAAGAAAKLNGSIDVVWPPDGEGYYDIEGFALMKGTPNVMVAQTFLDWASDRGMEWFQLSAEVTAVPSAGSPPVGFPELSRFLELLGPDLNFTFIAGRRAEWQKLWAGRYCAGVPIDESCVPASAK